MTEQLTKFSFSSDENKKEESEKDRLYRKARETIPDAFEDDGYFPCVMVYCEKDPDMYDEENEKWIRSRKKNFCCVYACHEEELNREEQCLKIIAHNQQNIQFVIERRPGFKKNVFSITYGTWRKWKDVWRYVPIQMTRKGYEEIEKLPDLLKTDPLLENGRFMKFDSQFSYKIRELAKGLPAEFRKKQEEEDKKYEEKMKLEREKEQSHEYDQYQSTEDIDRAIKECEKSLVSSKIQ